MPPAARSATPAYAYALEDNIVMWGGAGACVTLRRGDVWFADDAFVVDRSDLFSTEPPVVHSTTGRPQNDAKPLSEKRSRRG